MRGRARAEAEKAERKREEFVMGICKDCFHREMCEAWTTIKLDDIPPEIPCGHFKDTADVAPREEVEISQHLLKGAYKRIEELDKLCGELQKAKSDVAREIFEDIENRLLNHIADYYGCYHETFDELKKKYTGETEPQGGEKV